MQTVQIDKTPIDVIAALKGSPYEDMAEKLAEEFEKARITTKDMVHNAPLRLRVTYGVDIYEVMRLVLAYEGPQSVLKNIKKSS